jgi:hypothetical protein
MAAGNDQRLHYGWVYSHFIGYRYRGGLDESDKPMMLAVAIS